MEEPSDVFLRVNPGSDKLRPLRFIPGVFVAASAKLTLILTFAFGRLTFFFNSTIELDA